MDATRVVVVGAGLGGWRTATELRRLGHQGPLTVLGAERHLPYDRPPLSKRVLTGDEGPASVVLDDAAGARALDIDLRLGSPALRVLPGEVETPSGLVGWDRLVLASGGRPVRPAFVPDHPRVRVLRTLDDALALRRGLLDATSVVVVGGGFIGMEVAAAARGLDTEVTMVEAQPTLALHAVGADVGDLLVDLHRAHGVTVITGTPVVEMTADARGVQVRLLDGTAVVADLAVVGLGVVPSTEAVAGLGLDLSDGVLCDVDGRVLGLPHAWAVGDVARWAGSGGAPVRLEHWSSTADQAAIAAHAILDLTVPDHLRGAPYVWSDQYDTKLQVLGRPDLADSSTWLERDGLVGVHGYHRAGVLVAAATVGSPRLMGPYRRLVMQGLEQVRSSV